MLQLSREPLVDTVDLGFEQTVPRALVHKRSHENVLLTDLHRCSDDRFICAGRAPTAHSFFNDDGRVPSRDILFYTELGRQASLAVSHAFLGVGTDEVFIFEESRAEVTDAPWKVAHVSSDDPVIVEVRVRETARRKNNAVSRVVADHVMSIGGEEVFRGTGAWTIQPAALFRRLRRMSAARPSPASADAGAQPAVSPNRVQRRTPDNIVITAPAHGDEAGSRVASLIVDESHPYFFDHPCDHVPGMLLLEACAQLALAAAHDGHPHAPHTVAIRAYEVNFSQFVECGAPTTLTAHRGPDNAVQIAISQQNTISGTTTMRVAVVGCDA